MKLFTFGLARMHKEPGERRDFLPSFVHKLVQLGVEVVLEEGYGAGMGLKPTHYVNTKHPGPRFAPHAEVFQQDYVLVLRYPTEDEIRLMRPGACLISMVHLPTRPGRVAFLRKQGLEALSLDSVKDDTGRRLVENLRSVGWNGLEMGFKALQQTYPRFEDPQRPPLHVTVLGAGAVGGYAIQAAVRYGDLTLWKYMAQLGIPGVQVTVVDYDTTGFESIMLELLARTDMLVDATQRPDASTRVIPNRWLTHMPEHAVLVDLSVDPYDCRANPPVMKAIEGIPQGNLDQYIFMADDPAFDALPECVDGKVRRAAVACYSWPGVHPRPCMEIYGHQVFPLLRTIIDAGGVEHINPAGRYLQRAVARAVLSRWYPHDHMDGGNGHT